MAQVKTYGQTRRSALASFFRSPFGAIFITLAALALAFVAFAAYLKWHSMVSEVRHDLASIHRAILRSADDRLNQQEAMFKILGYRLLETDVNADPRRAKRIMADLMSGNPVFVGYSLVTAEGQVIDQTLYPPHAVDSGLVNLEAQAAFTEALASNFLTVGPTFFSTALRRWVIPLSYAVRDENGEPRYVISAGIDLDGEYNFFSRRNTETDLSIFVTNIGTGVGDYFPISYEPLSSMGKKKEDFYARPLPKSFTDAIVKRIESASGEKMADLIEDEFTVSFVSNTPGFDSAFSVIHFDPEHGLFLGMRKVVNSIEDEHRSYLIIYVLSCLGFLVLAFSVLFRMYSSAASFRYQMRYQARHDRLTDLPNRYFLEKTFDQWCKRRAGNYALLFMDLDNFKYVNDHYGHATGDLVLVTIADRLKVFCVDDTHVVRQSGDEFLILMPSKDKTTLERFAANLVKVVNEPMVIDNLNVALTMSVGIALAEKDDDSLATLMVKADVAMYHAKKYRNAYAFFNESMHEASKERAAVEAELLHAMPRGELSLVYQPQINATTGQVEGVEALVRWHSKKLGFVAPDKFIPVAENSGQITTIGNFVIERAFSELRDIINSDLNINVSINVSVQQLIESNFLNNLKQKLEQYQLSSESVTIEVTESVFIEDFGQVRSLLSSMNDEGFCISLDDFGTGYASLSSLRILPFTEVKIDRSFVADMLIDTQDENLVRGIINIGDSLGIKVVAEGVEEIEQAKRLKSFGCETFQGYYFAKPMAIEKLNEFLSAYKSLEI